MKKIYWAVIIFIAAASFRLTNMDLIEFKLDEARDVYEMAAFYKDPYLFQRGTIQSTGVYNPPFWYYLLAVLSFPSRDPIYLSFIIALINTLAIVFFYLVVRKYYDNFIALLSSLLISFSPWMINLSRKIWAPDLVLPFVVGIFYFLHQIHLGGVRAHPRGVKWAWFWLFLLLALLSQLHASGIFLSAAVLLSLILFHPRGVKAHPGGVGLKYAFIGLLLGLIPLIPYLSYQFGSGCNDCAAVTQYGDIEKSFNPIAFLRPFELIGGSSFNLILGDDFDSLPLNRVFIILFMLEFILLPIGVYFITREKKNRFLLIFLIFVPILYFVTATEPHLYYFLIISPIVVLIYCLGIEGLKKFKWIIGGFVICLNILFNLLFYNFLYQRQNISGDWGNSYKKTLEVSEEKLAPYKNSPAYELIRAEYFVKLFSNSL